MSDPAKSVEIEDVLSSIRRLVSEEGRFEARPKGPAVRPGKLVLTPALRVADRAEADARTDKQVLANTATDEPVKVDPSADELLQADASADEFVEVDTASDELVEANSAADELVQEPEAGSEGETVDASAPWNDPDATLFSAAQAAGEPIIQADHAVAEEGFPEPEALHEPDAPDAELVLASEEPLSARIEVLEAVIAQTDDNWEPDGLSPDAYSGTRVEAMEWQDHLSPASDEGTVDESTAEEIPVDVADESIEFDADEASDYDELEDERSILSPEEGYLDEESLRELVADIVREELQGALGERITRNVRKLVRREIHRALTAQEFE